MKFYQKHKQLSMWIAAFIFVASVLIFKELVTKIPAVFSAIGSFLQIISPFIAGFIIAFILYVPCNKIEKLFKKVKKPVFFSKHARGISVLIVYLACIAIIVTAIALIIPWLVRSLMSLYDNRDSYYESVVNFVNARCDENGKFFGFFDPTSVLENMNPSTWLGDINLEKLAAVADGVYKFGGALVDTVLAIFSSVYMLLSREALISSVGRFFAIFLKRRSVSAIKQYLCKISNVFYSYLYSTLIDALIVAVLCTVAFFILRVDNAPIFGFLVGVSNLVPYFGAIIAGAVVAVFVAVTKGWLAAIITVACILVIQQIDCNILQPRIIGKSVGLRPIYTLIAITVGGGLCGIGGVLLGVPVFATFAMLLNDLFERHQLKLAEEEMDEAVDGAEIERDDSESGDNTSQEQ